MSEEPKESSPRKESMAYEAGRAIAPYLLKAKWAIKGLAGNKEARIKTERDMGALLARVYEAKVPVGRDPEEDALLLKLGGRLAGRLKNKMWRFRFQCDRAGIPNALAMPGGYIYVSRDLVAMCERSEDELAFVLAHEMGHVVAGDAGKRFLTQALVNALLKMRAGSAGVLTPAVRKLFGKIIKQGFSQDQEFRADRFGLQLMKSAGFDPEAGIRMMERLQDISLESKIPLSEYFCSHPPMSERLARMRAIVNESKPKPQ